MHGSLKQAPITMDSTANLCLPTRTGLHLALCGLTKNLQLISKKNKTSQHPNREHMQWWQTELLDSMPRASSNNVCCTKCQQLNLLHYPVIWVVGGRNQWWFQEPQFLAIALESNWHTHNVMKHSMKNASCGWLKSQHEECQLWLTQVHHWSKGASSG